jgi:DNA-binding NarL/FixJ family response regulator
VSAAASGYGSGLMPPTLRVLIADDHRLFAESLMTVLSGDERIDVVGLAGNGEEAVEMAHGLRPDIVLMDLKMPVVDGLEATRRIRDAGLPSAVILLTGEDTAPLALQAREAGAHAFVRKDQSIQSFKSVFFEVASLVSLLVQNPAV